jgi:predicted ATPase/DNA-binding NarL/FixJ family response regulator
VSPLLAGGDTLASGLTFTGVWPTPRAAIRADGGAVDVQPTRCKTAPVPPATLRGSLPVAVASLVGREALVAEVADLVLANRLVTLTGVGGVGKTRLALEVGARLARPFRDGIWLIELGQIRDPAAVSAAVATALGVAPQGDTPLIETIAETVAGRRLLLVVDNCEHMVSAAAAAVRTIVGGSTTVHVLATSREPLDLAGEYRVPVTPLALEGGTSSDAVSLFVERARAMRPDFGVEDPETARAAAEICGVLDGIPLGIELAAARTASMTAVEVRDRLGDRFRLFRGSPHGPARQQTLRNLVGWSYDLLGEDEQALLRRASVFVGGFDLASIAEIVEWADELDVLQHLDSLVRKSLVVVDRAGSTSRYRLLETIRQFAEDQLAATGSLDAARDRHAAYLAREAARQWERWNGPKWRDSVDWVEVELANLRAALRWSQARGHTEVATDIAAHAALIGYSVQLLETVGWAEDLLPSAIAADVPRLPRLLTAAGYACFTGRAEHAVVNAHRATQLERMPGYEPCEPGLALFVEALCQVYTGHLDRYVELTRAVAALPGPARGFGMAAYVDGLQASGRIDEALEIVEDSVACAHALGNPFWVAYAIWIAGQALAHVDGQRALAAWDEGLAVIREHRVHFFEGFIARDAARLHTARDDHGAALGLFATALESFSRVGNVPQLTITAASVPELLSRLGRVEAAATLLGAMTQQPGSVHHVPGLVALGHQLAERIGDTAAQDLMATGAAWDLNATTAYAIDQIERARAHLARRTAKREFPAGLTRREVDVLRLMAEGLTTAEISRRLFISAKTADHHVQHVYRKIGASSRVGATLWAMEHAILGQTTT